MRVSKSDVPSVFAAKTHVLLMCPYPTPTVVETKAHRLFFNCRPSDFFACDLEKQAGPTPLSDIGPSVTSSLVQNLLSPVRLLDSIQERWTSVQAGPLMLRVLDV